MKPATEYTPLTRCAYGIAGRYRLHLGADHLLYVRDEYLAERYQRFYFRDLQAIILQNTPTRTIFTTVNIIAVATFALALTVMFLLEAPLASLLIVAVIGLGWLVSLIINQQRGPTCACYFQTAVGTEQIQAVNRFRIAERIINRIQPLINAAQGALDNQELLRLAVGPPVIAPPFSAEITPLPVLVPPPIPVPATPKHCRGYAHIALAALLALDIVVSFVDLNWPMSSAARASYALLMLFAVVGTTIGALITQAGSDLPQLARTLVWINIGIVMLALLAVVTMQFVSSYKTDERTVQLCFDAYSIVTQTGLCYGFWRALRKWR
jgi:hypothetical protein